MSIIGIGSALRAALHCILFCQCFLALSRSLCTMWRLPFCHGGTLFKIIQQWACPWNKPSSNWGTPIHGKPIYHVSESVRLCVLPGPEAEGADTNKHLEITNIEWVCWVSQQKSEILGKFKMSQFEMLIYAIFLHWSATKPLLMYGHIQDMIHG